MEMNQVLIEQGDLLYKYLKTSSGHDFLEFIDHDPETNQLSSVEPLAQVMVAAEQIQRQSAAREQHALDGAV